MAGPGTPMPEVSEAPGPGCPVLGPRLPERWELGTGLTGHIGLRGFYRVDRVL